MTGCDRPPGPSWSCTQQAGHPGPCPARPVLVPQIENRGRWLRRVTLVEGDLVVATGPDGWGRWAWGDRHAARIAAELLAAERARRSGYWQPLQQRSWSA